MMIFRAIQYGTSRRSFYRHVENTFGRDYVDEVRRSERPGWLTRLSPFARWTYVAVALGLTLVAVMLKPNVGDASFGIRAIAFTLLIAAIFLVIRFVKARRS